ncbi:hypothetical protein D5S17_32920 [Pseudonocardiaceae bacterium YIM PH 21723]|nr:hypothetical protein D5S17_32920 [Pseudonocardiaceae bacterium YIM PH 21723]
MALHLPDLTEPAAGTVQQVHDWDCPICSLLITELRHDCSGDWIFSPCGCRTHDHPRNYTGAPRDFGYGRVPSTFRRTA